MREIMYRDAVAEAIREEMRRDEKVFLMGEDVGFNNGPFKATKGLQEEFGPQRVRDTPLSEWAIASAATGAAIAGARPIAEIMFIDFCSNCMDAICNQMAKMAYKTGGNLSCPLVLRTQGGFGHSKSCTQSQSLEAWMTHIPGLKVVMPATPYDVKGLLKASVRDDNPVVFIEDKGLYQTRGEVPENEYIIPLGKADVKREGEDVSIISYSRSVIRALEAAKELEKEHISVEVIDIRTLVPLDIDTIAASVKKTGRAVIVHEAIERSGYGAEIGMEIQERLFDYLDAPVKRVCSLNTPVPFAPALELAMQPSLERIVVAVKSLL